VALRLWGAVDARRADLGITAGRGSDSGRDALAEARRATGVVADRRWEEGRGLTLDGASIYAARQRGKRGRALTGWDSLTPTELEIVRLVGRHLTNPQIAGQLFVSSATVKTHLIHIFAKLNVTSRSELAAQAAQHQMST
jgi:DNA-binding CsgD family transcriptional regulator